MAEKWALAMRNLEQMAIFQLETFRTGQKEASAYYAELRTANEIPARKLLEQSDQIDDRSGRRDKV